MQEFSRYLAWYSVQQQALRRVRWEIPHDPDSSNYSNPLLEWLDVVSAQSAPHDAASAAANSLTGSQGEPATLPSSTPATDLDPFILIPALPQVEVVGSLHPGTPAAGYTLARGHAAPLEPPEGGRGKDGGKEVAGCESLSRRKKLSQERSRRKISKTAHGSTVRASANTVDRSGNNWREWEEDERLRNRLLELIRVSIQHRSHEEPAPVPASQLEGRPSRYLAMLEDARARYGTDRISAGRDAQKSSIENESSV